MSCFLYCSYISISRRPYDATSRAVVPTDDFSNGYAQGWSDASAGLTASCYNRWQKAAPKTLVIKYIKWSTRKQAVESFCSLRIEKWRPKRLLFSFLSSHKQFTWIFYSKPYYCVKTEDYKIPCDKFDDIYTCGYTFSI
jgi:hypothetical protein